MVDCLIIGGGVIGCAAARALSRYRLEVAVVEKAGDIATGASRANSAIVHAGYDCEPGSDMAKYNVEGNRLYDTWCSQLDVPLQRIGSLVLAFDERGMDNLRELHAHGVQNGVPDMAIWDSERALREEPNLNPEVVGALYAPTGGITCPYELTIACAENAAGNGVTFHMDWPVTRMEVHADHFDVYSGERCMQARVVINAAGVHADTVARMIGDASFSIRPRRGEYMMLDRGVGQVVRRVIFQTPGPMGKGVLVSPTVDGNLFAGPTASDQEDRADTQTTAEGQSYLRAASVRSVPNLAFNQLIRSFSGLRAVSDGGDFIIRPSAQCGKFLHAAGICSPGLSSAPAIAEALVRMVGAVLPLEAKDHYQPRRKGIAHLRDMSETECERAIAEDARYAHVVCRCETVSEAEIVESIRRIPGARSVDGVKRRTRAGMGRCQGGFCSPRVLRILSRELGIPMEAVTQNGGESRLLVGKLTEKAPEVTE